LKKKRMGTSKDPSHSSRRNLDFDPGQLTSKGARFIALHICEAV
jgi:hypothetical protein